MPTETVDSREARQQFGVLRLPRKVIHGPGQRRALGEVVAGYARSVLVCTDARLGASSDFAEMLASLKVAGVDTQVYADAEPELPVDGVLAAVSSLGATSVDAVVGVGGGSCLDLAKAVGVLLSHGGVPQDYYGENNVPGPIVPVIAVPTTAGTGSEATPVAVLSDPARSMKVGISSPYLIPEVAIVDPELTHSCPASLTAASGIDAVVHLVESFTAIRRVATQRLTTERVFIGKSDLTDALALQGLKLMGDNLVRAYRSPHDAVARDAIMTASFLGGVSLGTAGTAAAHALQYPIGALTHTPHGFGTGCLLPYVMRYNFGARVTEFAEIARALGVHGAELSTVELARRGVEAVDELVAGVQIPPTLADLGVRADQLSRIAEDGLLSTRLVQNNPRPLDLPGSTALVTAAFHGDLSFPTL